jgi:hypothetical protein
LRSGTKAKTRGESSANFVNATDEQVASMWISVYLVCKLGLCVSNGRACITYSCRLYDKHIVVQLDKLPAHAASNPRGPLNEARQRMQAISRACAHRHHTSMAQRFFFTLREGASAAKRPTVFCRLFS